ncbi:MAG: hypothetical protein KF847_20935 [Pirellulales bacterium]|nr:hypothetical protein [Pirellulales bacterium]
MEVPPFGDQSPPVGFTQLAKLSPKHEWFVQAPVEITIRDGIVAAASVELPSIQ